MCDKEIIMTFRTIKESYIATKFLICTPCHLQRGYWSWMDGSLHPVPTFFNGSSEALTVTPAFFGPGGWLAADAYPRLTGMCGYIYIYIYVGRDV